MANEMIRSCFQGILKPGKTVQLLERVSTSTFVLPDELVHFVVAEMQLDVTVGHLNEKIPGCSLVCLQRFIFPPLFPMFGSPAP